MLARQHEAGGEIPGMGAFRIDEAGERAARHVVEIVYRAAEDARLAALGETGEDVR
jgi:hypothetical protein